MARGGIAVVENYQRSVERKAAVQQEEAGNTAGDAWGYSSPNTRGASLRGTELKFQPDGQAQPAPPSSPRPPSVRPSSPGNPRRAAAVMAASNLSPVQHRRLVEHARPASVADVKNNAYPQYVQQQMAYQNAPKPAAQGSPNRMAPGAPAQPAANSYPANSGSRPTSASPRRPTSAVQRASAAGTSSTPRSRTGAPPPSQPVPTQAAAPATRTGFSPRVPFPFNYIRSYSRGGNGTGSTAVTTTSRAGSYAAAPQRGSRGTSPSGAPTSPRATTSQSPQRYPPQAVAQRQAAASSPQTSIRGPGGMSTGMHVTPIVTSRTDAANSQRSGVTSRPPTTNAARQPSSQPPVLVPRIGIPSPRAAGTAPVPSQQEQSSQRESASRDGNGQSSARSKQDDYGGGMGAHSPYDGVGVVSPRVLPPSQENGWLRGYTLGRLLGEGGFCKVRLAIHTLTGATVAVKMIDKSKLVEPNDRRRVGREIRVLKRLTCGGIIKLFEVVDAPGHIYVVMEYADGGSLLDYVRGRKRLDENEARHFFYQMLQSLSYCHQTLVVHRDVKLENVLLDRQRNMKLIDFGLSAFLNPGKKLRVHCGSPSYAAPEIIARKLYDGPPVDVWSLGVVLFAMISGYLPFHAGNNKQELCQKIVRGVYTEPDFISPDSTDLLRRMLTVDPEKRITVDQILQHRWVRGGPQCRPLWFLSPTPDGVRLDEDVLATLESLGVARALVIEAVRHGQHNYISTSYFLLLQSKRDQLANTPGTQEAESSTCPCLRSVPACRTWLQTVHQNVVQDETNPFSLKQTHTRQDVQQHTQPPATAGAVQQALNRTQPAPKPVQQALAQESPRPGSAPAASGNTPKCSPRVEEEGENMNVNRQANGAGFVGAMYENAHRAAGKHY